MLLRLACIAVLCGAAVRADDAASRPSDQALLDAVIGAGKGAVVERNRAGRLLGEARASRPDEALAAAARAAAGPDAARLMALRARLRQAWGEAATILSTPWPVDPRLACRRQAQALRQAMAAAGGSPLSPERPVRVEAQRCLARLSPMLEKLRTADRRLEEASADARSALEPPARPGPGAAP